MGLGSPRPKVLGARHVDDAFQPGDVGGDDAPPEGRRTGRSRLPLIVERGIGTIGALDDEPVAEGSLDERVTTCRG